MGGALHNYGVEQNECVFHLPHLLGRSSGALLSLWNPKISVEKKMFGIFPHHALDPYHPLMRGLDDIFYVPHSRHTEIRRSDIAFVKDLQILSFQNRRAFISYPIWNAEIFIPLATLNMTAKRSRPNTFAM